MNVRTKRDGVEEVFVHDRASHIMEAALTKRYNITSTPDTSHACNKDAHPASPSSSSINTTTQRLEIPRDYTIRPYSRTQHFLPSRQGAVQSETSSSPLSSSDAESTKGVGWWCEDGVSVARAVVAECLRHQTLKELVDVDLREACNLTSQNWADEMSGEAPLIPLASWQEFFELPPRWIMQSLGAMDQHTFESADAWRVRRNVTPLDVGAHVRKTAESNTTASSAASRYLIGGTGSMSKGAYWVDLVDLDRCRSMYDDGSEFVDPEAVYLDPPVPLNVDPLLPCDELYTIRAVNTCVYTFFLRGVQQRNFMMDHGARAYKRSRDEDLYGDPYFSSTTPTDEADIPAAAAARSLQLSRCVQERRAKLVEKLQRFPWPTLAPTSSPQAAKQNDERTTASASRVFQVTLHVRVDVARGCVQLRAENVNYPKNSLRKTANVKGQGNAPSFGGRKPGNVLDKAPVLEVLLRSAQKLAALYDLTRGATFQEGCGDSESTQAERREDEKDEGEEKANEVNNVRKEKADDSRSSSAEVPCTAVEALTRLVQDAQQKPDTAATKSNDGLPSHDGWRTVSLLDSSDENTETPSSELPATFAAKAFFARLFTLLLRYRSLFGEKGYNQGPQAAVPPPIMEELATTFAISAEAFASPLNVQLPQFGSLFPDTDAYFGSLGSFFDVVLRAGHVEVNPPFDTALLRQMERHLLSCLAAAQESPQSLLFLVVLPSHDLDEREKRSGASGAAAAAAQDPPTSSDSAPPTPRPKKAAKKAPAQPPSTDRALRESSYCLGHVLCRAAESAYVDGHQHLLKSPFFCIGTPTRLILLGNAAARSKYPSAASQLEAVRVSWKNLTESTKTKKNKQKAV